MIFSFLHLMLFLMDLLIVPFYFLIFLHNFHIQAEVQADALPLA